MDVDAALIEAYNLGMDENGWSDAVMDRAEELLPTLIEAGYAECHEFDPPDPDWDMWSFTPVGVARIKELERDDCPDGSPTADNDSDQG